MEENGVEREKDSTSKRCVRVRQRRVAPSVRRGTVREKWCEKRPGVSL